MSCELFVDSLLHLLVLFSAICIGTKLLVLPPLDHCRFRSGPGDFSTLAEDWETHSDRREKSVPWTGSWLNCFATALLSLMEVHKYPNEAFLRH